jgi:hypothetical protein
MRELEGAMDLKVTVSQAAHANRVLLTKIMAAHLPLRPGSEVDEQEPYHLVALHRRQEASGGAIAALSAAERAVLALFA